MDSNQNGKTHLLPYLYICYTFFQLQKTVEINVHQTQGQHSVVFDLWLPSHQLGQLRRTGADLVCNLLANGVTFLGFSVGAAGTEFPPPPGCIPSPIDWSFSISPPTAICLGYMQLEHGNNKTNKSKISGVPCMYKQGTWLVGSVKHLSFHLHRFPKSGHLAPHLHRPCCQRCEPFRNPAAAEK